MTPRIALVTLALNEERWITDLYRQHFEFPGLEQWVMVESADRVYAEANPDRVRGIGRLSVDGTTDLLRDLARKDRRVTHLTPGGVFGDAENPAQGKSAIRDLALRALDDVRPDFVFVLDADEFYTFAHQREIADTMASPANVGYTAFGFGLRSIWRPPSIAHEPLLAREARGGVWSVPICRGWRWFPGMTYSGNHNSPEVGGASLATRMLKRWGPPGRVPECVHMGFAAPATDRRAKHAYYEARGEGRTDHRGKYVACRSAWEKWVPGKRATDGLPSGCLVLPYDGPKPECFKEQA